MLSCFMDRPIRHIWAIAFLLVAHTNDATAQQTGSESCSVSPLTVPNACFNSPVDAKSKGWSPWTHKPICVKTLSRQLPQLCVFTSTSFRGGSGLSVLGTPELAASIVDKFNDAVVKPPIRDHPSSLLASSHNVAYEVQDIEGKGKGLVATRKINKWDIILVDFPALLVEKQFQDVLTAEQRKRMLELAVRQLPKEKQEEVMTLAHATDEMGAEGEDRIEAIMRMNVFTVDMYQLPFGLFPKGSRINHDCRPNAFWRYSKSGMAQEYVAMRNIEPGEEITHSYTAIGLSYKQRSQTLMDWGFECKCSLCTGPVDDIKVSDMRRELLRESFKALQKGEDERNNTLLEGDVAERVNAANFLIDNESLWPVLCQLYQDVASAYLKLKNIGKARKYVRAAERVCDRIGGEDHGSSKPIYKLWVGVKEGEFEVAGTPRKPKNPDASAKELP